MARHTFFCIDAHTCGNPVRVVVGGAPLLPHVPMAERRALFMRDHDWVRRALMFEPRGHDVMSGSILYPPTRDACELGALFIDVSAAACRCADTARSAPSRSRLRRGWLRRVNPAAWRSRPRPGGLRSSTYKTAGMSADRLNSAKLTQRPSEAGCAVLPAGEKD